MKAGIIYDGMTRKGGLRILLERKLGCEYYPSLCGTPHENVGRYQIQTVVRIFCLEYINCGPVNWLNRVLKGRIKKNRLHKRQNICSSKKDCIFSIVTKQTKVLGAPNSTEGHPYFRCLPK
jgi:hypothetical protein